MDASFEVSDPSDWLQTPVKELAPVETALRCQVCKDFFDTPMITSCSHTFCSLCIRRCLTNDGKCPACRAPDQELRLRRNWTVEELVESFKRARESLIRFSQDLKKAEEERVQGGRKRKREVVVEDLDGEDIPESSRRKTRSQGRRGSESQPSRPSQIPDSEEDEDYEPDDGLTACPICGKRMKEAEVFPHLDVHNEPAPKANGKSPPSRRTPIDLTSRSRQPAKPMERLPQLSYGLLKDQALRKKLSDLGIPSHGPKLLLIKRHTEWVNLVNANCDSSRPRSKRELLNELDTWERSQGRNIMNGLGGNETSSVMRKDFDGAAWATNHGNDFQQLIARARQKPPAKKDESNTNGVDDATEDATSTVQSPHFAQPVTSISPRRTGDESVKENPPSDVSRLTDGVISEEDTRVEVPRTPLGPQVIEVVDKI